MIEKKETKELGHSEFRPGDLVHGTDNPLWEFLVPIDGKIGIRTANGLKRRARQLGGPVISFAMIMKDKNTSGDGYEDAEHSGPTDLIGSGVYGIIVDHIKLLNRFGEKRVRAVGSAFWLENDSTHNRYEYRYNNGKPTYVYNIPIGSNKSDPDTGIIPWDHDVRLLPSPEDTDPVIPPDLWNAIVVNNLGTILYNMKRDLKDGDITLDQIPHIKILSIKGEVLAEDMHALFENK